MQLRASNLGTPFPVGLDSDTDSEVKYFLLYLVIACENMYFMDIFNITGIQGHWCTVKILHFILLVFVPTCVDGVSQHNCPVGNVDLQGRTALHDAGKINRRLFYSVFYHINGASIIPY